MQQIRSYFEELVPLTESDWLLFASRLQKHQYPKKELLLKTGQTENYLSFIEKGSVRLYIPKLENDITFGFCFENQFVSAYDSFIDQKPSTYQIETLSQTVLWRMSHSDLQQVYALTEAGETIGRLTAEQLFLIKAERELSLLNETAEERYMALFKRRPNLFREIPLKYIASYIGVTPQALSRIRRRIT
jgi:CRP-like cAMP-binding protein